MNRQQDKIIKAEGHLNLDRCPHCNTANPTLRHLNYYEGKHDIQACFWNLFSCTRCTNLILHRDSYCGISIWPSVDNAVDGAIPDRARNFLQQARDAIHTPDACLMVCASALDAMLQEKDVMPDKGTLNDRIKASAENHLITEDMANWANQIRLEANDIRHPENNRPLATPEEALQNLEFTEALAEILFVLPARVTKGLEKIEENKIPK